MVQVLVRLIISTFLISLIPYVAYGHGKETHTADMRRVFPFVPYDPRNKEIERFYYLVNAYIDYPDFPNGKAGTGTPQFIRNHPKFGKLTYHNHRGWFHWGFNKDPRKFAPLSAVIDNYVNNGILTETDREEFWYLVHEEVRKRNKYLMDKWAKISGYQGIKMVMTSQRRQANGFVTLLYSVHLLGDHQTSEVSVIIDRKSLYGDIYNAIDNLAGNSYENRSKAKSLKNKLRLVQGNPKAFLDKMEKEFTPFLYSLKGPGYDYRLKFNKYKLK